VALEYLDLRDSSGNYKVGIYKIDGNTLVEVWHGLEGQVGGNYEIMPPDHFISTCRMEGISRELPVIMGSQSDVSLSYYSVIGKNLTGEYDLIHPFPIPQKPPLRRGERGAREEKDRLAGSNVGPVGGIILNNGDKVFSYGIFINRNKHSTDAFGLLEGDHWKLLGKTDSSASGNLCRFTIGPGKSGWLFIKDGRYNFYEKLPVAE
jgi:hypothetical protein